jgi:uncharacterized membrane protein YeaQ/YmgE (transglycosylase-associated protein family)
MHTFLLAYQTTGGETVQFTIQVSFLAQLLTWIVVGLIAGFLAGSLVRGRRMGLLPSLVLGFIGAVIGGVVYNALAIPTPDVLLQGIPIRWIDLVVAFCGSLFVLIVVGALFGWRR